MKKPSKLIFVLYLCSLVIALLSIFILPRFISTPKLSLKGDKYITIDVFSSYKDPGATAIVNKKDLSHKLQVISNVDTSRVGNYSVKYEIEYNHKICSITRYVDVIDREPPIITLDGEKELTISSMYFYKEPGYSSNDNYDGNLTEKVEVIISQEGDTCTITYLSTDSSGISSQAKRVIHVKDIVSPVITLKGSPAITLYKGSEYMDEGASAIDDLDGDITSKITATGSVDTLKEGIYTIEYKVSDSSGNTASAKRILTVKSRSSNSVIYLTFDDGPSSNITPQILDILKSNNIKATFFIVNFSDSNAALVKRAIKEGHTIGIHGYSHDYKVIYSSDAAFMENISNLNRKIQDYAGYYPFCMRFPGGSSNTVSMNYCPGIMTRLVQEVTQAGYAYYDWNVSAGDATSSGASKSVIIKNVISALRKERSNIVLMHDAGDKQTTADALQEIINYGKANGYTFLPITKDTNPVHHRIAN